jgi:hypothetical protein
MSLITFSAEGFVTSVLGLIVVPLKGYDEPENVPSQLGNLCKRAIPAAAGSC